MALTPEQRRQTRDVLVNAFSPGEFDSLVYVVYGLPRSHITKDDALPIVVTRVVEWADGRGDVRRLIEEAARERPTVESVQTLERNSRTWDFSPSAPADDRFPLPHGLTALPAYHVPRVEELARLDAALAQATGAEVALTALEGLGGVGKSTLALAYCYSADCAARFPDGVLWGRLGPAAADEVAADSVLLAWGEALRLDRDTFARMAPADKAATLRRVLGERRVLLVVDDMWHAPPARPLQAARGPRCAVLLTTRSLPLAVALECEPLRLDTLTEEEALALLAKRLGRALNESEQAAAQELVQRVGYHPLAVQLAGAQLRLPGRSWESILAPLRAQQGEIAGMLDLDRAAKESSLATCFDWSYNGLDAAMQRAYRWLGVLAPEAPFDMEDAGWLWQNESEEIESDAVQRVLNALTDAALLETVAGADGGTRYRQHLLLRDDARRRLRAAGEFDAALLHHAQLYVAVARSAAEASDFKPIACAYAQIEAVLRRAWRALRPAPDEIGDGPVYPAAEAWTYFCLLAQACNNVYWYAVGHPKEALRWLPRVALAARASGDRLVESNQLGNLALAYATVGLVEQAIETYLQLLSVHRELNDQLGEGADLNNLAMAYAKLQRFDEAIEYSRRALSMLAEIGDQYGESAALGNLGYAYYRVGLVDDAVLCFSRALAISRNSGNRADEGRHLAGLGIVFTGIGKHQEAVELFRQALKILTESGDRPGQCIILGNLGCALVNLGQANEAISLHEEALAIDQEIGNPFGQAEDWTNLGGAFYSLDRYDDARRCWEEALRILTEIKSPYAGQVREWLAELNEQGSAA
jgi:tetratricopeptide (TPR) repeat protein